MKLSNYFLSFRDSKNKDKDKQFQIVSMTYNIKNAVFQNYLNNLLGIIKFT